VQPNITGKVLQAVVDRGGNEVWVGGRGGTILKRTYAFEPNPGASPKTPPTLRTPAARKKIPTRTPMLTITDDGDIPRAVPPKKDN
jgi:hypothetical protein